MPGQQLSSINIPTIISMMLPKVAGSKDKTLFPQVHMQPIIWLQGSMGKKVPLAICINLT